MTELEYLAKQLDEEFKRFESDIALGSAKDFAEYKYACGMCMGLLKAKGIVLEMHDRKNTDGDRD